MSGIHSLFVGNGPSGRLLHPATLVDKSVNLRMMSRETTLVLGVFLISLSALGYLSILSHESLSLLESLSERFALI